MPRSRRCRRTSAADASVAHEEDQEKVQPSTCEEADRRAWRAPWSFSIWAVVVLIGSHVCDERETDRGLPLGMVLSLVPSFTLVSFAQHAGLERRAPRRWTWSSEGPACGTRGSSRWRFTWRRRSWRLGPAGCRLLGVSDRSDRGSRGGAFLLAMVPIASFFMGFSAAARATHEIVLDPERIRFAAGTSRESLFWWLTARGSWAAAPVTSAIENDRVGRIRRDGHSSSDQCAVAAGGGVLPHHPELCAELATGAGAGVYGTDGPASVAPLW